MRPRALRAGLWIMFLLHFGCATMMGGSKQTVSIDSDPKGATVTGDELNRHAVTPTSFSLKKGGHVHLAFDKEGYKPTSIVLDRRIAPSFWGNLLLFSGAFVPMSIDALTGAMWDYQDSVYVHLEPINPVAADENLSNPPKMTFQQPTRRRIETSSLSGPRFGLIYLSPVSIQKREAREQRKLSPLMTQFGWQFEYRLREGKPISLVYELIPLVNGIDQDTSFLSVQGLLGVRTKKGLEFSIGPYFNELTGATRTSTVINVGFVWEEDGLYLPFGLSVIPRANHYEGGTDYSLLTGFSW